MGARGSTFSREVLCAEPCEASGGHWSVGAGVKALLKVGILL